MNKLPITKRVQIINMLVEGSSLRSTSRVCDVSINTVTKLLVEVGAACEKFHNKMVVSVASKRIQCDEIWSFVYSKQKNVPETHMEDAGDVWTWTAIDADSKLVVSWLVGDRSSDTATAFMNDVAAKIKTGMRIQLTSDGYVSYLEAVTDSFRSQIDFAQLVKTYGNTETGNTNERKYSPVEFTGAKKTVISGNPDDKHISTSYIERQNLTMRMHMRRFTRLTNPFSKKIENHCLAIALHFVYYNFAKVHKTLRVTPAMEAKLVKRVMSIEDIVRLAEIDETMSKKRGQYKKKEPKTDIAIDKP